jgi:hypothetical protein
MKPYLENTIGNKNKQVKLQSFLTNGKIFYMRKKEDLVGQRFGLLKVIQREKSKGNRNKWICECECGMFTSTLGYRLKIGKTKSCGCYRVQAAKDKFITHGYSTKDIHKPEYRAFYGAKTRCNNTQRENYFRYGGRGIEFRFNSFAEFLSEIGDRPTHFHSLDRINPDGHYEKGNVQWSTLKEQSRNKSRKLSLTFEGETKLLKEWSESSGIAYHKLYDRKSRGFCSVCILSEKLRPNCKHK